jgi:hypothetical protein
MPEDARRLDNVGHGEPPGLERGAAGAETANCLARLNESMCCHHAWMSFTRTCIIVLSAHSLT